MSSELTLLLFSPCFSTVLLAALHHTDYHFFEKSGNE